MKRISSLFKSWLDAFIKEGRDDYQLDKYIVPEYSQIKQAHRLLLKEYARAIAAVSRLSFFIGFHEIKLPKEGIFRGMSHLLMNKYVPFRLFVWKPLVQLFVEAHIRRKLAELSIIYTQTEFLVQDSLSENPEYSPWLKQARQECDEFRQTLSSGKILFASLRSIAASALALFLAAVSANSLGDFLVKLSSGSLSPTGVALIVSAVAITIFLAVYLYFFWDFAFTAKRLIFTGIGLEISKKQNIYIFENEVFKLLGRGKSKELPIDYLAQAIFQLCWILFFFWMQGQFNKVVSATPNSFVLPCFSIIGVGLGLSLIMDVIKPLYNRYTRGYM